MAEEDLIFGKNRHFFGGIEPSSMSKFEVTVEDGVVKIEAELPPDTIVNGQTLCSVAGAVIRRKDMDYPENEFDGDHVVTITESGTFVDSSADPTSTYFYAAFPYTTQGVYSVNAENQSIVNGPDNMVAFSATSVYDSSAGKAVVELSYDLPDTVAGAVIRKSSNGYPINETDGELVINATSDGSYVDANVTAGVTYYYSAFPYSASGVYNRDSVNRASVAVKKYTYLYGYDLDTTDSDPYTRVTYPSDVDNSDFTAAAMNFSSGTFDYGSWPSTPGEKFMPKPCMLTYAGTVDHYLDPNDYTKREDGSTSSSAEDTSFDGNAMMEWPKIYTKRWEENGIYHFRCSDVKIDDEYECWCNYDKNNNEIDHFYTAIYFGSNVSRKMRSISGQSNFVNHIVSAEITIATANGTDWYTEVLADRLLINDLLVMMAKTTDCQTAYGRGNEDRYPDYSVLSQGTMNTKGLFWGDSSHTSGVKVFGMENWWGNLKRRTAGWTLCEGVQSIKITRGTKDGSTATDYNGTGSGYISVEGSTISGTYDDVAYGYVSECKTTKFGRLPIKTTGSSTTYETDAAYYYDSSDVTTRYASVGGCMRDNQYMSGPFYVDLQSATSGSGDELGTTLSCKPSAT